MRDLILSLMRARGLEGPADLHRAMADPPSVVTVRAWCSGASSPAPASWPGLAAALGVSLETLADADKQARLDVARGAR